MVIQMKGCPDIDDPGSTACWLAACLAAGSAHLPGLPARSLAPTLAGLLVCWFAGLLVCLCAGWHACIFCLRKYSEYQRQMHASNDVDFDDLLFYCNQLLMINRDFLKHYQKKC